MVYNCTRKLVYLNSYLKTYSLKSGRTPWYLDEDAPFTLRCTKQVHIEMCNFTKDLNLFIFFSEILQRIFPFYSSYVEGISNSFQPFGSRSSFFFYLFHVM